MLLGPVATSDLNYSLAATDDSTATADALLCNVVGDTVDSVPPSRITTVLIGWVQAWLLFDLRNFRLLTDWHLSKQAVGHYLFVR